MLNRLFIGVFALLLLAISTSCTEQPRFFSLQVLVNEAEALDGRAVITEGRVRTFDEPRHYWIEDAKLNRVAIEPDQIVKDLVGEYVRVEGHFYINKEQGRRIEAYEIWIIEAP